MKNLQRVVARQKQAQKIVQMKAKIAQLQAKIVQAKAKTAQQNLTNKIATNM